MNRTQHAPKSATILIAFVLVVVGVLGTFFSLIPAVAGISGETIGIGAYVVATILLLLGVFTRGL